MKKWLHRNTDNSEAIVQLQSVLSIPYTIARLLVQRNVLDFETAKEFFKPDWSHTHDPYLMKDMDRAVQRITAAISNNEKILVYGDYDVDGTTAVSLVYSYLHKVHQSIDYYIPDRHNEGYGVSRKGVEFAANNGFSLIIALDCGIKANKHVKWAKNNGVEFIICDHHRPGDSLPEAVAILDPKREDCSYPYDELCGCAIGFKLIQAINKKLERNDDELNEYLDLVAIAIAADIVPMNGENRVLCTYGLKQINESPRIGIQPFIAASKKSTFNVNDVVFTIAPRINAAGRIHSGRKAVELLISSDSQLANSISEQINTYNSERKELDQTITNEALNMIANNPELQERKTTVLYSPEWHKGVIGIVASRLMETYYRPTIVLTKSGDLVAGSARSVHDFDVYNALEACSEELSQFGGHKYAAGMTLKEDQVQDFALKFEQVVSSSINPKQLIPFLDIDAELDFTELTPDIQGNPFPKLYRLLRRFSPFGPFNLRPIFVTHRVVDNGYSQAIGEEGKHLRLNIKQQNSSTVLSGIGFNLGHLAEEIKTGQPFSIAYTLEENEWNNNVSLQLNVKDIKFTEAG